MPSIRVRRAAAAVLVAAALGSVAWAAPAAAAVAGQRFITETDLFRFVWVADPQISPDGQPVTFVRVTVNAKKDGYDQTIWTVATDGAEPPQPFTGGKQDSGPRWSPQGRWLALARNRLLAKGALPPPGEGFTPGLTAETLRNPGLRGLKFAELPARCWRGGTRCGSARSLGSSCRE